MKILAIMINNMTNIKTNMTMTDTNTWTTLQITATHIRQ